MDTAALVQEVKTRKPALDKDKHTEYLTTVVNDHLSYAEEYTNNTFTDPLPKGVLSFIADACEYGLNATGLEARTLGDVSYNFEVDYTPAMLRKIRPYKRVKF